jgi:hypothetical protein
MFSLFSLSLLLSSLLLLCLSCVSEWCVCVCDWSYVCVMSYVRTYALSWRKRVGVQLATVCSSRIAMSPVLTALFPPLRRSRVALAVEPPHAARSVVCARPRRTCKFDFAPLAERLTSLIKRRHFNKPPPLCILVALSIRVWLFV